MRNYQISLKNWSIIIRRRKQYYCFFCFFFGTFGMEEQGLLIRDKTTKVHIQQNI